MAFEITGIQELNNIRKIKDGLIIVKNGKFNLVDPLDYGEIIIKYQDKKPISIKKAEIAKL